MPQTAINKPIYDAFVDAGASEEKATLAACAVLPSVDEAATKTDFALLSSAIERLEEVMTAAIERSEETMKAAITGLKKDNERSEETTKAAITGLKKDNERSEEKTKANIAELKVDLLRWMVVMLGVVVAAIGVIVNMPLGGE